MILSNLESNQFFELYKPLLTYTNKVKIFKLSKLNKIMTARNYLFDHLEIFDQILKNNPANFDKKQLNIILNWKNKFIRGNFIFFRQQKQQAIFLKSEGGKSRGYKVLGLTDSPENLIGIDGVYLQDVVILPFGDKIVWDGLFHIGPILGKNYLWDCNELYKELKSKHKIMREL
jgi:hypothetical protein